jgi:hypothetical protein
LNKDRELKSERAKSKEKHHTDSISFINRLPTNKGATYMNYGIPQIQSTHAVTFDRAENKVYNHYFPWVDHKKGEVVTVEPSKKKRTNKWAGKLAKRRKTRVNCTALKAKQDKRAKAMQNLDIL